MAIEHKWPVSSYSVTMVNGIPSFGWIKLNDGDKPAGFIYFQDSPSENASFGGPSEHPYIIIYQPISMWPVILDVLRNEKPLYIRGIQPTDNTPVTAMFGTSTDEPVGEGEMLLHGAAPPHDAAVMDDEDFEGAGEEEDDDNDEN